MAGGCKSAVSRFEPSVANYSSLIHQPITIPTVNWILAQAALLVREEVREGDERAATKIKGALVALIAHILD